MQELADTEIKSDKIYLLTGQFNGKEPATYGNGNSEKRESVAKRNLVVNNSETNKKDENTKLKFCKMPSRRIIILALVCLSNICAGCSYSILDPFFPQEAERKGMSKTVTGLVFSIYQLIGFVCSVFYGTYLSRIGPKFLFVSGILAAGTCSVLFGLIDKSPPGGIFITLAFIIRIAEAVSVSAFITSSFAIVCTEFPQHVSTVFGMTEVCISMGYMIGPAIGGVLNEAGGFSLSFYVIGACILVNGFITILMFPPPQDTTHMKQYNMLALLRNSLVWEAMHCLFLAVVGLTFLGPVLSFYLEQFHLTSSLIGLVFVIAPCLYGMTTYFWGCLLDTKDIKEMLIIWGGIISGVSYLLIGSSPLLSFLHVKLWVTIVGLVLFGVFFGCLIVAPVRCIIVGSGELGFENNLVTFGLISGLFNATLYMGSFAGPLISGAMVETLGFRWSTTIMSGIYFVSALISSLYFLYRYLRERRNKQRQEHNESVELTNTSGQTVIY